MTSILIPLGSETRIRPSPVDGAAVAFNFLNFCLRFSFDQFTSVPILIPVAFMISDFVTPLLRRDFTNALMASL